MVESRFQLFIGVDRERYITHDRRWWKMSREQLSLAVREAKRSDEKIHAPGKLERVRIINQGIISGDLFGINLAFVARIPGLRTKR